MLALLTDSSAPDNLSLNHVGEPEPQPSQALIRCSASSLNRGELKRLAAAPDGTVPGWDLAGIVERPAADGSGPSAGARVAGVVSTGAWAELVAVPTSQLAVVPEQLELTVAAVLPLAGLTALGALRQAGSLYGRRVAVSGAAGGVGRLAVQLAARAGAHVSAIVGNPSRAAGLTQLGADEVLLELDASSTGFDVILESVGGAHLAAALTRVNPGGTIVTFGNSSGEATTFDTVGFYGRAPRAMLVGFTIFDYLTSADAGQELGVLLANAQDGTLEPSVASQSSWRELGPARERLLAREVPGKVAIRID